MRYTIYNDPHRVLDRDFFGEWNAVKSEWSFEGIFDYEAMGPAGVVFAILLLSFILSISSQIGDLICSKFKRTYDIKDFSQVIPGHGGILDRFDSVLFASNVFLSFITICRILLPLILV